jgi:hypothetical protein
MFSVSLVSWERKKGIRLIHLMEDLSTAEMLSPRGGGNSANVISFGNVAIAVPIDIVLFSGNAVGTGSKAGIGNIVQLAEAQAGTELFKF